MLELEKLRQAFSKLKIERDNLVDTIEESASREKDWQASIKSLNEELLKYKNAQIVIEQRSSEE